MNETIIKYGYPENLLKEFRNWVVLLRPQQITAGSLVLACKENAESLSAVTQEAYKELSMITREIEKTLKSAFNIDKINYLALMMVDKQVHFHVIPRYSKPRELGKVTFTDLDWPKPPNVLHSHDLSKKDFSFLKEYLLKHWQ